jgi:hypothetical protein
MAKGSRCQNKNRKRDGMSRRKGCHRTDIESLSHFFPNCDLVYNAKDFIGITLIGSIKTFREEMKDYDCLLKYYNNNDGRFADYFDNMIDMGRVIWYFDMILNPILDGNFKFDKYKLKKCQNIFVFDKMSKIKVEGNFDELQ